MIDLSHAEWLQSESRIAAVDIAGAAGWGDVAQVLELASTVDASADANALAAQIAGFFPGALVEETVSIADILDVNDLTGKVLPIVSDAHSAYGAGPEVFILGGGVDHGSGITQLTVLRRL